MIDLLQGVQLVANYVLSLRIGKKTVDLMHFF